jgi:recombinational DNA repair protein RecR
LNILDSKQGGGRIAYGLPMGAEIKYADQQTLRESLSHRVET